MLLPAAERRGEICFYFAKSLPYGVRMAVSFALFLTGMAVQATHGPVGVVLVLLATLPLLTKGYDNIVRADTSTGEWRPAGRETVDHILAVAARQRQWDHDVVDISCGRGFMALLAIVIVTVLAAVKLATYSFDLALLLPLNVAAVCVPFWVTGIRSIVRNDRLVVKAQLLTRIEDAFKQQQLPDAAFQYQALMAKVAGEDGGEAPLDVRAMVLFRNAPESFLGLQTQVSINSVQGADYPYAYCVIVTKADFARTHNVALAPPSGILVEFQQESDVDVIVVRQDTGVGIRGYYTKPGDALKVFSYALGETRRLLDEVGAGAK